MWFLFFQRLVAKNQSIAPFSDWKNRRSKFKVPPEIEPGAGQYLQ